jgi:hypothetical protein
MPPNKEQSERLKEWLKIADDPDGIATYCVEGERYFGRLRFADRAYIHTVGNVGKAYERHDITCHLHVSLETSGQNLQLTDLCISYQRLPEICSPVLDHPPAVTQKNVAVDKDSRTPKQDWVYQPMFVVVREPLESKKGVRDRAVPSLVRLVVLDDCPMAGKHIPQGFFLPAHKILWSNVGDGVFLDGELDAKGIAGFPPPTLEKGQLPHEVVQGRSEVLECVAHDEAEPDQQIFRGKGCSPEDVVSAFTVVLDADSYAVRCDPESGVNLTLKGITVLFGPVELGPTTSEVGLVGHD